MSPHIPYKPSHFVGDNDKFYKTDELLRYYCSDYPTDKEEKEEVSLMFTSVVITDLIILKMILN